MTTGKINEKTHFEYALYTVFINALHTCAFCLTCVYVYVYMYIYICIRMMYIYVYTCGLYMHMYTFTYDLLAILACE